MSYPMCTKTKPQATPGGGLKFPETTLSPSAVEEMLISARIKMLLNKNAAFFGKLACGLKFIDATAWCPTAATDGRNFYYNRDFVVALQKHSMDKHQNQDQVVFLVAHEVMHCIYSHMLRRGNRIPELWNIAGDYRGNQDLVDAGIGKLIDLIEILYDHKWAGKTTEEIYDELYKEADEQGRIIRLESKLLDQHLDGQGSDGEDDGDANDGSTGPIRYTQDELEDIDNQFRNQIQQASRTTEAGNLPAGVRRLLDQWNNPKLDWREMLAMNIKSLIKNDFTYQRFNRKGLDQGFYFPGMDRDETIDIVIGIDLSGSIGDEQARDFLGEIKSIMDQYTDFKIHLFCFDTEVHNPQVFTQQNMDDFLSYELVGGGGTDFMACWEYMKDRDIQPQKFIMFTDMMPWGSWGDENYCDTLFIAHSGIEIEAPFGTTVQYTRD